jgi:aromatic-L-amino-acid decarboxylase
MAEVVLSRVLEHVSTLASQPIRGPTPPPELLREMREPTPHEPSSLDALLGDYFAQWLPLSFNCAAPGYLAYVPGGGVFPAALADFIADATNRFTGMWQTAPALVQLEANALDWIRDWMQFPESTRGLFTTGGSMANFNAILCARERLLGPDIRTGVLYASSQVHHSVLKSARLAGIMPDRVRLIGVGDDFRMRPDALEEAVRQDRADGLAPFMVVCSAGTTNTGAVDPLPAIGDFCRRHGLWHHVDGAYGAFFHVCEELRPLLAGLPQADSLTLDPHKGLFLPYGTGALLVRDGEALRAVHAATSGYLPPVAAAEFFDPSQYGPDLSRGFPGLRVWLTLKLYGLRKVRAAIAEKRQLALDAARRFAQIPGITVDAPPQLSLFAFHLGKPGASVEAENQATRALLERVAERGQVMMSGCSIGERFLGRVCVLSFRTHQREIDLSVEQVAKESSPLLAAL